MKLDLHRSYRALMTTPSLQTTDTVIAPMKPFFCFIHETNTMESFRLYSKKYHPNLHCTSKGQSHGSPPVHVKGHECSILLGRLDDIKLSH